MYIETFEKKIEREEVPNKNLTQRIHHSSLPIPKAQFDEASWCG